jgi:hypothetical protein
MLQLDKDTVPTIVTNLIGHGLASQQPLRLRELGL